LRFPISAVALDQRTGRGPPIGASRQLALCSTVPAARVANAHVWVIVAGAGRLPKEMAMAPSSFFGV
jgi:hypothetical protein